MKPYSVAIIGLGAIGLGYDLQSPPDSILTHTRACLREPRVRITCGVDPDPSRRAAFTRVTGAPTFASVDEMLQAPSPDILVLATPTATHLPVFERIATLHPRVVIHEKPIADSVKAADTISSIAMTHRIAVTINYIRLADPALSQLALHIHRGDYGEVRDIRARYCRGLRNNGSHIISFILACCGSPTLSRRLSQGYDIPALHDSSVDCQLVYPTFNVTLKCLEPLEIWDFGIDIDLELAQVSLAQSAPFLTIKNLSNHILPLPTSPCDMTRYQRHALSKVLDWLDAKCPDNRSWDNAYKALRICEDVLTQNPED